MAQKRFENYKPDIKLEYRDDDGRLLSTKDAYRHMSHQFHGKGPGKGKIEKKLKRDEEERKKMSKSIFGNDDDKTPVLFTVFVFNNMLELKRYIIYIKIQSFRIKHEQYQKINGKCKCKGLKGVSVKESKQ